MRRPSQPHIPVTLTIRMSAEIRDAIYEASRVLGVSLSWSSM